MNDDFVAVDPAEAASLGDLARCLRHLHVLADRPSYRVLENRTQHANGLLPSTKVERVPLRRSTLSEVLQGQAFPRKAFMLTFVYECGVDLQADRRWEGAWNRLAPLYQEQAAELTVKQLRDQLEALRRQLAAAEDRAEAESRANQEQVRAQKLAESQLDMTTRRLDLTIRRAEIAERLLRWERIMSGSKFVSVATPKLGEGITMGTITRWLKREGDRVEAAEPLLEVSADDSHFEIFSPIGGQVRAIMVREDEIVVTDTVLAVVVEQAVVEQALAYSGPQPVATPPPPGYQSAGSGVSLAEAVQAAHEEGQKFGASVARDAPGLWLEAVLARKPRMPSDLEARMLQGSALPIDFLEHDEVRQALRRGFWDSLERARR